MEIKEITQRLELVDREKFSINGVTNVEKFSQNEVLLKTIKGGLRVCGSNLNLEDLSKQSGGIYLTGKIDVISFEEIKEKRHFLKDIFK